MRPRLAGLTPSAIRRARFQLLRRMPYLASALMRLTMVEARGLDGIKADRWYRLYYDPDALEDQAAVQAQLLAVVWHLVMRHWDRRGSRDLLAWNLASMVAVNGIVADCDSAYAAWLRESGQPTAQALDLPLNWTTERYYEHLNGRQNGLGRAGEGDPVVDPFPNASDAPRANSARARGISPGAYDPGSCLDGIPRPWELPQDDAPIVPDAEAAMIASGTAQQILQGKNAGSLPGNAFQWAQSLAASRIDWRARLATLIRRAWTVSAGQDDFSLARHSRRAMARGIIAPGTVGLKPDLVIAIDTSGSMSAKELRAALGQLKRIWQQLGLDSVTLLHVDAKVQRVERLRRWPDRIRLHGRGGTDMSQAIAYAESMHGKLRPAVLVILTDGFTPWPRRRPDLPVVVGLIHTDVHAPATPWWAGTVHIREAA